MAIKAVVDTNVWVSAVLNPGTSRRIVQRLQDKSFDLHSSVQLMAELINVLSRRKIAALAEEQDIDELLELIQDRAMMLPIHQVSAISRDPEDDVFLSCALACNADYLVTGDNDLLSLDRYGNTKIVTPAEFLQALADTEAEHEMQ